jgi:cobaltochelatase CobS
MKKTIKELFGVESKSAMEISDAPVKYAVQRKENYVFRKDLLRDMLIFWNLGRRSAMLTGHKGSGKTSIVEQFHNRLNINLQILTGNGKTGLEALFGQYLPNESGSLTWQDGPVTSAARHGHSVLINEFNAIPEDVQIALNDVCHEGSVITLESGEHMMPSEGFRVYATINPKGSADYMYRGRKEMDAALKERFFWINVGYADPAEEQKILRSVWTDIIMETEDAADMYVPQMMAVAQRVRAQAQSTGADAIPEIISTRVLENWAIYWAMYANESGSAHKGLQRALTYGCRPEVATVIHQIVSEETAQPSPYKLGALI